MGVADDEAAQDEKEIDSRVAKAEGIAERNMPQVLGQGHASCGMVDHDHHRGDAASLLYADRPSVADQQF